jgi:hypothetical protein
MKRGLPEFLKGPLFVFCNIIDKILTNKNYVIKLT